MNKPGFPTPSPIREQVIDAERKDTAAFDQFVKAEIKKWGTVVKESNAKVD